VAYSVAPTIAHDVAQFCNIYPGLLSHSLFLDQLSQYRLTSSSGFPEGITNFSHKRSFCFPGRCDSQLLLSSTHIQRYRFFCYLTISRKIHNIEPHHLED